MYGLGVAVVTRGISPLGELAIPVTPLNPLPPATSASKTSCVSAPSSAVKDSVVVSAASCSG